MFDIDVCLTDERVGHNFSKCGVISPVEMVTFFLKVSKKANVLCDLVMSVLVQIQSS